MLHLADFSKHATRSRIRELSVADEATCVKALLENERSEVSATPSEVEQRAEQLIDAIRERHQYRAGIDALLTEYSLSSREGVMLMCLAEALLRVPDKLTADRLIRDKIDEGDWQSHIGSSQSLFVNASAWGLLLTGKFIRLRHQDEGSDWHQLKQTVGRYGAPAIRSAMRLAMRIMGTQFVIGTNIGDALDKSEEWLKRGYYYSYDMLGEAARTADYAQAYFEGYCQAIEKVGSRSGTEGPMKSPGFSVKLSALHPRYELAHVERLRTELVPRVLEMAQLARQFDLGLTIDAEEANRLEIMLDMFERVFNDSSLYGWEGLGVAVQAYLKNAPEVIEWLLEQSSQRHRRIMVRLVKGAYWDAEIKHAQIEGLSSYPVFTRKASSDLCYLACARKLLSNRDHLYPQFATHNAHSAAAVLQLAGDCDGFEFQRLHGMGQELYEELLEKQDIPARCRIYAPVGIHRDLLAYLVRRLLENGANSSFVHNLSDESLPTSILARDPRNHLSQLTHLANPGIPLPRRLFGDARDNSLGADLDDVDELARMSERLEASRTAAVRLSGVAPSSNSIKVLNPADPNELIGQYEGSDAREIDESLRKTHFAFDSWSTTPVGERADCLRQASKLMEKHRDELIGLCIKEAGKSLRDSLADVREAIDFCRYYAHQAVKMYDQQDGRIAAWGPFLCISPWNFPAAIFAGQLSAALAVGNTVIAKPAEQTTLIALRLIELFHEAGIPEDALVATRGPGEPIGMRLFPDSRLAGVMFTGSTEVAKLIAKSLSLREGDRLPLIAETGGQNAMVVDSTALPEQVVDDVIASGFNSAGQRCSALRVLFVQEDIADRLLEMLVGAMKELRIGDPANLATDIGPIIDIHAKRRLDDHVNYLEKVGRRLYVCELADDAKSASFFAPRLYEVESIDQLTREVFGPIVHVIRFDAAELEDIPRRINSTSYGLTFGVHSRIELVSRFLASRVAAGNVYVNRNMIGAVVGVQPFGGRGLSGTGPKAGGPNYLSRLVRAVERFEETSPPVGQWHSDGRSSVETERETQLGGLRTAASHFATTDVEVRRRFAHRLATLIIQHRSLDRERWVQVVDQVRELASQTSLLLPPTELPGPTGESNTLVVEPRGIIACLCREGMHASQVLLPMTAAMLAGNAVVLLSDSASRVFVRGVRNLLTEAGFPDDMSMIQGLPLVADFHLFLARALIDGVACFQDSHLAELVSRTLANRDGPILPLIDDGFGPAYLRRFVHEKVISVNTTASGGNTTLMSQNEPD